MALLVSADAIVNAAIPRVNDTVCRITSINLPLML